MPNIVAGIPARYSSTRFPGKPLAVLGGKPVIEHVYRRAAEAPYVDEVIVATDDERIAEAVRGFGGEVRMTRPDHASGSDRLAELFETLDCKLAVNVQGDEPLIDPQAIGLAIEAFFTGGDILVSTLMTPIRDRETLLDPNAVKVTVDKQGFAVHFSREPDPPVAPEQEVDLRITPYYKHLGLYVYPRSFLLDLHKIPPSVREQREKLEQFRILDNGFSIKVAETPHDSPGIDTPEDLARAEALLQQGSSG